MIEKYSLVTNAIKFPITGWRDRLRKDNELRILTFRSPGPCNVKNPSYWIWKLLFENSTFEFRM
jgi:hypothetical protein